MYKLNIKQPSDVYNLYAILTKPNPLTLSSDTDLSLYLFRINSLGKAWGNRVAVQAFTFMSLDALICARNNYLTNYMPITNPQLALALTEGAAERVTSIENYFITLMKTITIYFKARSTLNVKYRVYLNVEPFHAIEVMSYVLFKIVDEFDEVSSTKITLGNTSDTIVIYIESLTVSNQVVEKIREYQKIHGNYSFRQDIPEMTKHQIQGVATGEEPPKIYMEHRQPLPFEGSRQSFGVFRCDLIYQALKDSKGSAVFFELIVKYFRDAGLDANDPSIQTRFYQIQWEAQRNLATNLLAQPWDYW
ncbi:MAG: hypothetical protein KAH18_07750 [Psychromonas sp.]|nr:hypothetical protein [Psychromonas sp.]